MTNIYYYSYVWIICDVKIKKMYLFALKVIKLALRR